MHMILLHNLLSLLTPNLFSNHSIYIHLVSSQEFLVIEHLLHNLPPSLQDVISLQLHQALHHLMMGLLSHHVHMPIHMLIESQDLLLFYMSYLVMYLMIVVYLFD
jgi:hypothetical protein